MRRHHLVALVVALALGAPALARAQEPPTPPNAGRQGAQPGGDLSPAEIQRMFDAYALLQAQDALDLDDEHYGRFVSAMKDLQETRRRNQQERMRRLRDLNQLAMGEADHDAEIVAALAALQTHDRQAAAALEQAYARLDGVLTPRQRARFRTFEEAMERRKLDLLMRARQANRPRRQSGGA